MAKKMKSHSGAKQRFRVTGSGRLVRRRAGKNHLMEHKGARRARRLSGPAPVARSDQRAVRRMLGR